MLEVRYNINTSEVTGWCGDEAEFGNLQARWGVEAVVVLDISVPDKPLDAYLFNTANKTLMENPSFIEPPPTRDLFAEIDDLKAKVEKLEKK